MPNDDNRRIEVITGVAGRRYWLAHEKLRIIEESLAPGESVSAVARRNGVVMDHLGFETAVIGGMSMGGPVALSMYEKAPDRFTGMILIDTTASAASPAEAGLWQGVAEIARNAGKEPIITTLIPDMLTGETRLNDPAVSDYLSAVMEGSSVDGFIGGPLRTPVAECAATYLARSTCAPWPTPTSAPSPTG